ncbi:5'-3' exonuclease H3TH domain-containing protein [uncultured Pseudokineococcus sp.]|uniref:5'-3' exonuclease n=1 Tax=uncultured Pseudokineococcus sp. TaxID=1642928 RepID=UPI002616F881|nr:5'-3' exonuclease H3TH domain-containing protein [uncultured Pseudokineococcus sp.]
MSAPSVVRPDADPGAPDGVEDGVAALRAAGLLGAQHDGAAEEETAEGVAPDAPLLLAVDGNSLLHRAHHAHAAGQHRDAAGRPVWALRGVVSLIASAAARLTPDALVVGFDCARTSVRRAEHPAYKAHRPEKHPDLRAQLDDAPALLAEAGLPVVVAEGFEADDVLCSAAELARRSGWRCTAVTSDRDSFALVDASTSVLRVLNGGIGGSPVLTPRTLPLVTGVRAGQYRCLAALRGDTSDNLPGALGIGPKTAARLLAAFESVDDVYAALDDGREAEVRDVVGPGVVARLRAPEARANVARNQRLMAMRDDLALPDLDALRLPLDVARVQAALGARDVRLGPSLWALVGGAPPADRWSPLPSWVDEAPLPDGPPDDGAGAPEDTAAGAPEGTAARSDPRGVSRPAPAAPPPPREPLGARGLARARKEPGEDQLDLFG